MWLILLLTCWPVCPFSLSPPQIPLQKLLFSATLTQNPEKLQQLGLHQPRLFSSVHGHAKTTPAAPSQKQDRFDFPEGLTVRGKQAENHVSSSFHVVNAVTGYRNIMCHARSAISPSWSSTSSCVWNSAQPSVLPTLERQHTGRQLFKHFTEQFLSIFVAVQTQHLSTFLFRLHLLVQLFGGIQAAEFSSRLSPGERKKTLKDFEQGKIQLWVWIIIPCCIYISWMFNSISCCDILMINDLHGSVYLKVDQHRRSCQRHRHQRGQICCQLWCTAVH